MPSHLTTSGAELTGEQKQIAETAFEIGAMFAHRRFDDAAAVAKQWEQLAAIGFTALSLPEEFGGAFGIFELCLAMERLAAGGFPASPIVLTTGVAAHILNRHGTPAQREEFLPRIADGSVRFCFALTEAGAGSNAMKLATSARRVDRGWRISGAKTYISGYEVADLMLVVARDADTGGLTLLLIPLPYDGVTAQPVKVEIPVFDRQWSIFFDDVVVPDEAIVGEPGKGHRVLFDGLNPERLTVAAMAVGIGRWCLSRAVEYAKERVVFDVPIGQHQAVQHPLAESFIALEGGWALLTSAAHRFDEGEQAGLESSIAKIAACDAGLLAADRAIQTFGGSAYTEETMLIQRFLWTRLVQSVPVSRELALNHVATTGLGLPHS